jgi:hypothetical protein
MSHANVATFLNVLRQLPLLENAQRAQLPALRQRFRPTARGARSATLALPPAARPPDRRRLGAVAYAGAGLLGLSALLRSGWHALSLRRA